MNYEEAERLERAAAHLPKAVQKKIHGLIDESSAAHAGLLRVTDGEREAHQIWVQLEVDYSRRYQFTRSTAPHEHPIYESRDEVFMENAAPRLVAGWQAWQRSKVNVPHLQARWDAYSFLFGLIDWLPKNRHFTNHVPVQIKGTNHIVAVEGLRGRIAEIEQRRGDVEHANCDVESLVARAENEVDRLAGIGSIHLDPRIREGSPVNLDWSIYTEGRPTSMAAEKLVFLFADEIKSKLATKIRSEAPSVSMSDFERAAELSALEADKLKLEREEEAHIAAAAEQGQFIPRRREADPRAILEVE